MNSDPTAPLTYELVSKLAELDSRLNAYRANLAIEYRNFARELFRSVHRDLSSEVERVIAESVVSSRFPILGRDFVSESSPAPSDPSSPRHLPKPTRGSPPPSVCSADSAEAGAPAGDVSAFALDRNDDLHGVFTPIYLPLLDSSHATLARSPGPHMGSNIVSTEMLIQKNSIEVPDLMSPYANPQIQLPIRPSHMRRATDETTSSVLSDRSDSRVRRSALRRSSSSSKQQSPRRVRFDFEGAEVLPTSSPQVADAAQSLSRPNSTPTPNPGVDASGSFLGDAGEEPPPKKVSSSQALRTLSRAPLDIGTVWTVVNPQSDEDLVSMNRRGSTILPTAESTDSVRSVETVRAVPIQVRPPVLAPPSSSSLSSTAQKGAVQRNAKHITHDDRDGSSDEENFLSMKPKAKKLVSPMPKTATALSAQQATAMQPLAKLKPKPPARSAAEVKQVAEDEVELFEMEGLNNHHWLKRKRKPNAKTLSRLEDEDSEAADDTQDLTPRGTPSSASAAVEIKPRLKEDAPAAPLKHPVAGSVGSYKGRPISMPVAVNPDVYDSAASMGNLHMFVGSVDGRTGVDDANLGSIQASLTQANFSGTPRSLTERMLMEDRAALKKSS